MGDYSIRRVLFDPSSVEALFAHSEALQAQSARLSAEALLLTARLRDLTTLSTSLIAAYHSFSINWRFK